MIFEYQLYGLLVKNNPHIMAIRGEYLPVTNRKLSKLKGQENVDWKVSGGFWLVAGVAASGGAWAGINDGLVGWYKLDGNVNDSSTNALNGSANGSGKLRYRNNRAGYQFIGDYKQLHPDFQQCRHVVDCK